MQIKKFNFNVFFHYLVTIWFSNLLRNAINLNIIQKYRYANELS